MTKVYCIRDLLSRQGFLHHYLSAPSGHSTLGSILSFRVTNCDCIIADSRDITIHSTPHHSPLCFMNKGMTLFPPAEYFTKKFYVCPRGRAHVIFMQLSCTSMPACLTHCSAAERARGQVGQAVRAVGGKNEECVTVS